MGTAQKAQFRQLTAAVTQMCDAQKMQLQQFTETTTRICEVHQELPQQQTELQWQKGHIMERNPATGLIISPAVASDNKRTTTSAIVDQDTLREKSLSAVIERSREKQDE